ncbi:MAG: heme o synthase [Alphaproteobacteria bacterium]|nr:heme o synthase [Alphaproteobacteria bacterium]
MIHHKAQKNFSVAELRDFFILLKPRVMALVVFTGFCGMMIAPGTIHPFLGFVAIACLALGTGAAGALNMWYDRDIDRLMHRTEKRPLPAGRMQPEEALSFGIILSIFSVMLMGLAAGWQTACLLAGAISFYVFIYTIWLKRRTPQNIVIGGAAGAFPPLIGWVAVTGSVDSVPLILFLLIFLWTPPHFWALALYRQDDFRKANLPMMPMVKGEGITTRHMLYYAVALFLTSLLPPFFGVGGYIYMIVALSLGGIFVYLCWHLYKNPGHLMWAQKLFTFSIIYLFLLFTVLVIDQKSFYPF